MGIKDLFTFLQKRGISYEQHRPGYFSNSVIAIDAYSLIYKIYYTSKKIAFSRHIEICIGLLKEFIDKWPETTKLIFIFDNPVKTELKKNTLKLRRDAEISVQAEIKDLQKSLIEDPFNPIAQGRIDVLKQRAKDTLHTAFDKMIKYLKTNGYDLRISPGEGEKYACQLSRESVADYVFSNDSDCLALGCPVLIFEDSGGYLKMYRISNILEKLDLSEEQFRDFCILLGTDFNTRVMPPEEAYRNIVEYGSIDDIPKFDQEQIEFLQKIRQEYVC